jgi:Uma2 family endonuclease
MAVTPQRMTLAEFLVLPEVKPARELRHGVVSQKVPPSGPHGSIQKWFAAWIYNFAEARHLAEAFTETRVVLGTDTYVPDVIVYLWDRVPEDDDGRLPYIYTTAPDLVLEILSPGQTVGPLLDRCRELVGHGVRAAMLADPVHMSAHVIRRDRELGPLRAGDVVDLSDILPDFTFPVSELLERVLPGRRRS